MIPPDFVEDYFRHYLTGKTEIIPGLEEILNRSAIREGNTLFLPEGNWYTILKVLNPYPNFQISSSERGFLDIPTNTYRSNGILVSNRSFLIDLKQKIFRVIK